MVVAFEETWGIKTMPKRFVFAHKVELGSRLRKLK